MIKGGSLIPNSGQRGSIMVQFAIALPVLITLLGGVIDLGEIIRENTVIVSGARAGARAAATLNSSSTTEWLKAVAEDSARQYISQAGLDPKKYVVTACNETVDVGSLDSGLTDRRNAVRVTVKVAKPRWYFLPQNATGGEASSLFVTESGLAVEGDCA